MTSRSSGTARRGRPGRPARIDRERILAAAKKLDPSGLTMKAVADVLGVDRSALHYHVPDRDALVAMVASDAFHAELGTRPVPVGQPWQEVVRQLAELLRDAMVRAADVSVTFEFSLAGTEVALQWTETALAALVGAGLPEEEAMATLAMLSQLAAAAGRDAVVAREGRHPQMQAVDDALKAAEAEIAPILRRTLPLWAPGSRAQFEYDVRVYIAGVEAILLHNAPRGERTSICTNQCNRIDFADDAPTTR